MPKSRAKYVPCKSCIVPTCCNSSSTTPEKVFVSVPMSFKVRKKWTAAIKKGCKVNFNIPDTSEFYCCADHFELPKDVINYKKWETKGGDIKLKANVVPHKFNPVSFSKQSKPNRKHSKNNHNQSVEEPSTADLDDEAPLSGYLNIPVKQETDREVNIEEQYHAELRDQLHLPPMVDVNESTYILGNIQNDNILQNLVQNIQNDFKTEIDEESDENKQEFEVHCKQEIDIDEEVIVPNTEPVKCDRKLDDQFKMEQDVDSNSQNWGSEDLEDMENYLQLDMKTENEEEEDYTDDIKPNPNLHLTDTHLIANKLINTTSTITRPQDGIVESQTTRTLVMEITPVGYDHRPLDNPQLILPTNEIKNEGEFQLNSITGDGLSFEGLLNKPQRNYQCNICTNTYTSKYNLNKHLKVHESIDRYKNGVKKAIEVKKQKKLQVKNEEEEFKFKKKKVDTKESTFKEYECVCGIKHSRRIRMEACLKSHSESVDDNLYECTSCPKKFKDKEELALHRRRLHSRKKFICKFCPTEYDTRKGLFKHLRRHQKLQLTEFQVISDSTKKGVKFKCILCSKNFTELDDLKTHFLDDHKEPYKCPDCSGNFTKITEFSSHYKTEHSDKQIKLILDVLEAFSKLSQAWKCEECNIKFSKPEQLALHKVEAHTKEDKPIDVEQVQCTDCLRVFVSNKSLNSHRRVHHSILGLEEPPLEQGVLCVHCRKVCKDENALTSHMRLHSPDRKFVCKYCDFRFATAEKRKSHCEVHTGDMRYVCFICEYTCSSENRLNNHKESAKHKSMKEYLLNGKPLETVGKEETPKCSKEQEWEVTIKKIRKCEEKKEIELSCDICGEEFPSESEMLEHKQTHPFIEFANEDTPSRIFFK